MSAASGASGATCTVTEVLHGVSAGDAIYEHMAGKVHVLVPVMMRVACRSVGRGVKVMALPKYALPFGLLTSITLTGEWFSNPKPPGTTVTLRLEKATGVAEVILREVDTGGPGGAGSGAKSESRRAPKAAPSAAWRVEVDASTPLAIAQDAVDRDIRAVKAATGHTMAWRAIAAGAIGGMSLAFGGPGPTPSDFDVEFRGVNAILIGSSDPASDTPRPTMLLPPLPPAVRLAQLEDRESERRAAGDADAGAENAGGDRK
jgi:hypothetical protein